MASPELQVSTLERKSPADAGSGDYGEKPVEPPPVSGADARERSTEIIIGERELRKWFVAIQEVRVRCGQQDDRTTDPDYFISFEQFERSQGGGGFDSPSSSSLRRVSCSSSTAALRWGWALFRGGDALGESLVAGADALARVLCPAGHPGSAAQLAHPRGEP